MYPAASGGLIALCIVRAAYLWKGIRTSRYSLHLPAIPEHDVPERRSFAMDGGYAPFASPFTAKSGNARKFLFPDSGTRTDDAQRGQPAGRCRIHAAPESAASKKPSAISGKGRSLRGTTFVYHSPIPSFLLNLPYLTKTGRILSANGDRAGTLTAA